MILKSISITALCVVSSFPEDVCYEGRRALAFFKRRFGIDFTDVDDQNLLEGRVVRDGVILEPFNKNPNSFYRVVSATDTRTATRFNNFISDAGWSLFFSQGYNSTGSFRGAIPPFSIAVYGDCAFQARPTAELDRNRKGNNTDTLSTSSPVTRLHYEVRNVVYPPNRMTGARVFDLLVQNDDLGLGAARGTVIPLVQSVAEIDEDTVYAGTSLVTFPESVPHNIISYDE